VLRSGRRGAWRLCWRHVVLFVLYFIAGVGGAGRLNCRRLPLRCMQGSTPLQSTRRPWPPVQSLVDAVRFGLLQSAEWSSSWACRSRCHSAAAGGARSLASDCGLGASLWASAASIHSDARRPASVPFPRLHRSASSHRALDGRSGARCAPSFTAQALDGHGCSASTRLESSRREMPHECAH
jgi:hypothetical protein